MTPKFKVILGLCTYLIALPICYSAANTENAETKLATSPEFFAFIDQVMREHPVILSAKAEIEAANYMVTGSSKPVYNPEFEAEAESGDVSKFTVGLNQTVDWHGKKSARLSEAELQLRSMEIELLATRERLGANLLFSLVNYLSDRDVTNLSKQRVDLMQRFVMQAENRKKAGDIPQIEMDTARLALAEAIIQYAQSNSTLISDEGEILALTGIPIESALTFPTDSPEAIAQNLDSAVLAGKNPELQLAKNQVLIAKSTVQVVDKERKADPNFGFLAGVEDSGALVTLNFSVPLNIRNNFSSQVSSAQQQVTNAEQLSLAQFRKIRATIDANKRNYDGMLSTWELWKSQGQVVVKQHISVLERLWKTGEINTTQYLIQLQQVLDTQVSGANLRGEIWRSWVKWLASIGGVNEWLNSNKAGESK